MEPLKNAEEPADIAHVEAGPVVADENGILATVTCAADFNDRRIAISRVFEGVAKQVLQCESKQGWVADCFRKRADPPFHVASGRLRLEFEADGIDQSRQRNSNVMHFDA